MESVLGALETELLNGQPEVNKIAALRWDDDGGDDVDDDDACNDGDGGNDDDVNGLNGGAVAVGCTMLKVWWKSIPPNRLAIIKDLTFLGVQHIWQEWIPLC